jgi:hypothetical protein
MATVGAGPAAHPRRPTQPGTVERLRNLAPAARLVGSVLLAAWFAWHTYDRLTYFIERQIPLGMDATIYHRAVVAWLEGGSPWDAAVVVGRWPYHYAGTPVTTVLMAPAGLLAEATFTVAWLGLTWVAASWTLRRLGFPLWWLLFPPLAEALYSANPQVIVLALLVANSSIASAVATALKVYAFLPLLGERRWRQVAAAIGLTALTVVAAPGLWLEYVRQFGFISGRLAHEATRGASAFYFPALLGLTLAALAVLALRDRRAAGWLAVPAVWPASQFHYSTMALPVMSPLLAALLAIPYTTPIAPWLPRLVPVVILLEVARRFVQPWIARAIMDRPVPGPGRPYVATGGRPGRGAERPRPVVKLHVPMQVRLLFLGHVRVPGRLIPTHGRRVARRDRQVDDFMLDVGDRRRGDV